MQRNKNRQKPARRRCALTIAGSDSGGGAGIQADLKTFEAIGVHGTAAIACITAQNPKKVLGVQPVGIQLVRSQLQAIFDELPPQAIKTGMLYSRRIIDTIVEVVEDSGLPLIVDPVLVATSGAVLLRQDAVSTLESRLLPLATLATPNLLEAEYLLGVNIETPEDLRAAARDFHTRFGCAALVKGGHLKKMDRAVDFFYDGRTELLLEAPFVRGLSTHGTGCTYSAAIAAYCALGKSLPDSVRAGKEFISKAIASSYKVGRHSALNSFWRR